ncbi:description family protein [Neisseria meningitidis NM151]|nr:description family protein [Neisseria meningitidis NM151]
MNHDITFLTLFLLGFFGGTHCIGMCGGLSSAFALQLPPHINRFWLILLLNTGRVSSYTAIGLILGLIGQVGVSLDQTRVLQNILYTAANLLLLFLGLYLSGISSLAAKIEKIGKPSKTPPALRSEYYGAGCRWFTARRFRAGKR